MDVQEGQHRKQTLVEHVGMSAEPLLVVRRALREQIAILHRRLLTTVGGYQVGLQRRVDASQSTQNVRLGWLIQRLALRQRKGEALPTASQARSR